MEAAITFDVYGNFYDLVEPGGENCEYEWDYSKALEKLNKSISEAVKNNKLTFLYRGKRVEPILPIEEHSCGNIFEADDRNPFGLWNDVAIWCKIDIPKSNFVFEKFVVKNQPNWMRHTGRLTKFED